jgi:hypothetical protein
MGREMETPISNHSIWFKQKSRETGEHETEKRSIGKFQKADIEGKTLRKKEGRGVGKME